MSAANEAWDEWHATQHKTFEDYDAARKVGFMAGYRRALEDAADAIQDLHPGEVKASVTFLRARAAAVAPRETKD